jgi:membrane associated rhomboid family serine protease
LVGFLIASGIFRKKIKALLVAIIIFFLYGGVVWGVLPTQPGVSWESHLFGFLTGILLAYVYRNKTE